MKMTLFCTVLLLIAAASQSQAFKSSSTSSLQQSSTISSSSTYRNNNRHKQQTQRHGVNSRSQRLPISIHQETECTVRLSLGNDGDNDIDESSTPPTTTISKKKNSYNITNYQVNQLTYHKLQY